MPEARIVVARQDGLKQGCDLPFALGQGVAHIEAEVLKSTMKLSVIHDGCRTRLSPYQKVRKGSHILAGHIGKADAYGEPVGDRKIGIDNQGVEIRVPPISRPAITVRMKALDVVSDKVRRRSLRPLGTARLVRRTAAGGRTSAIRARRRALMIHGVAVIESNP